MKHLDTSRLDPNGYRDDGSALDCPLRSEPFLWDDILHLPASQIIVGRELGGAAPTYTLALRSGPCAIATPLPAPYLRAMSVQLGRAADVLEAEAGGSLLAKAGFSSAVAIDEPNARAAPPHRARHSASRAYLAAASILLGSSITLFAQRLAELLQ